MLNSVRMSAPYLNNSLEKAVAYRSKILSNGLKNKVDGGKNCKKGNPFGEDVKMVRQITRKHKYLTAEEKDEVVAKYTSGMTMKAIADDYGCCYTTVGRLLRQRGIEIRK